jgi:hypothetical protein
MVGAPGQTATLNAIFIGYPGFVQFQVNGVNVGAAVPVTGTHASVNYLIPSNTPLGEYRVTAILLSVNGVPLQTVYGYLVVSNGGTDCGVCG